MGNGDSYTDDSLDILVGGYVSTGDLLHHLLRHSPQGKTAIPGPGYKELIVQPGLVKDPVVVRILTHADRIKGGQPGKTDILENLPIDKSFFFLPVNCHVIAIPSSSSK